jgi:hypothetical protein
VIEALLEGVYMYYLIFTTFSKFIHSVLGAGDNSEYKLSGVRPPGGEG